VARLAPVELELVQRARTELEQLDPPWVEEYSEHQSGGWWTLSLLNDSGDPRDVVIRDCEPVSTSLLRDLPAVRALLDSFGLRYMWARLARLTGSAFLWEHRDYDELLQTERYRLHVPLVTNESAYLVVAGVKVCLRTGSIWRLTPTVPHGVCNLSGPDRIHLLLDCYPNAALMDLVGTSVLDESDYVPLDSLTESERDRLLADATDLARNGDTAAAERTLLRLFYHYSLPEGSGYDLISHMYRRLGDVDADSSWQAKKSRMLGVRHGHGSR